MNIKLSPSQALILKDLLIWYKQKSSSAYITLGGYAGTGKTTLIALFRQLLHKRFKDVKVAFVSFTGKAARVLRYKLEENQALYKKDFIGTIHSLIYSPVVDAQEQIIGWEKRDKIDYDLIIIDEASMVDQEIWHDLLSYNISIVAVGDHGQLPPIKGQFNLMQNPSLRLEKIYRQAKNNPIIELSILARKRGRIPVGDFGSGVKKYKKSEMESGDLIEGLLSAYSQETLVLTGYNSTRVRLNNYIRTALGYESEEPLVGDRVICLRNNHQELIYNGMLGTIQSIGIEDEDWYKADILMDGEDIPFSGLISKNQFNNPQSMNFTQRRKEIMKGDLFDFGYALTVHKAQGSQAKKVVLFEERFQSMDDLMWKRWLYTGVTRAEEELYIIGD